MGEYDRSFRRCQNVSHRVDGSVREVYHHSQPVHFFDHCLRRRGQKRKEKSRSEILWKGEKKVLELTFPKGVRPPLLGNLFLCSTEEESAQGVLHVWVKVRYLTPRS